MLRTYTKIVGVVLLSMGLAGLADVVGWQPLTGLYHLVVGLFFAYLGFLQRDVAVIRTVVGGMGVLLLLVKAVTIFSPSLLGDAPLHGPIEITCLVIGLLSILAAKYLPDGSPT